MIPDFSRTTVETLAKRASFLCSNPDCRVSTVGPNENPKKATVIGEAAHIHGARMGSPRFDTKMNDATRAEITNAIWLCRNCHKLIDTDEHRYPVSLLYKWRESHEQYVASALGTTSDQFLYQIESVELDQFQEYPPIIRRIVIDKSPGWEWRLTAELMKHLNDPIYRRLQDLHNGLYLREKTNISEDDALDWIGQITGEMSEILAPVNGLLAKMTASWGEPGIEGDVNEIHHVCLLFQDYLQQIVKFEEKLHFTRVPEDYMRLHQLLIGQIGSQINKLSIIPKKAEELLLLLDQKENDDEEYEEIRTEIVFELPPEWEQNFQKELNRLKKESIIVDRVDSPKDHKSKKIQGCLWSVFFLVIIYFIFNSI
ncbi:hypothetical protein GCM10009117_08980 [Gangjinia marincola]|uniref:HNH endonuclease n=1 Tax=Gangjinia marincola TaxID=578463 RepID=A0ABP3XRJ2_9FLAO